MALRITCYQRLVSSKTERKSGNVANIAICDVRRSVSKVSSSCCKAKIKSERFIDAGWKDAYKNVTKALYLMFK